MLDKALQEGRVDHVSAIIEALLRTGPARNYAERRLDDGTKFVNEKLGEEGVKTWLSRCLDNKVLTSWHSLLAAKSNNFRTQALYAKLKWSVKDADEAFAHFKEGVALLTDKGALQNLFDAYVATAITKTDDASAETLEKKVRDAFPPESEDGKRLKSVLEDFAVKRTLHKDWLILGPFSHKDTAPWDKLAAKDGKPAFAASFKEGEGEIKWTRPFSARESGIVDLFKLLKPTKDGYGYAAAELVVEKDTPGLLLLGSDTGATVWLDGKEIHKNLGDRSVKIDEDKVALNLTAGVHTLVLRIEKQGRSWGFCARIGDTQGKVPLVGVTLRCPELPKP